MPAVLSPHTPRTSRRAFDARDKSPSYFGLSLDGNHNPPSSSGARDFRRSHSPPTTSIRASAVSPPQTLPFHSTTNSKEYDAFKKEIERNRAGFNEVRSPQHVRTVSSRDEKRILPAPLGRAGRGSSTEDSLTSDSDKDDFAYKARSPKRQLSEFAPELDRQQRESPVPMPGVSEVKMPRLSGQTSLPGTKNVQVRSGLNFHNRAETLPERATESGIPSLDTPQHIMTILEQQDDSVLLLDLRVVTLYARSHIKGALNLCVPTTLLKRSSYSVSKLADTFKDANERSKFENWKKCRYLIVYDANSTQLKEAANCSSITKKFAAEGWNGESCIIRGGFAEFSHKFPRFIHRGEGATRKSSIPSLSLKLDDPTLAPVIGGCPMPATKDAANPFFGNIRQNMDLIGGVGQMPIKLPKTMDVDQKTRFPTWLKIASSQQDEGKLVAQKFLRIEKREQKRMQEALSGNVSYGTPRQEGPQKVQIAGIEKGAKNRYNNIWPFDHSRVKLQGLPTSACDYVNANYVGTSLSEKNYIATQGPIPATFSDFWTMVWQSDVRVIVMLTAESEGGQVKAHNYWNQRRYGQMKLKFLSEHRASLEPAKIREHREQRPPVQRKRSSYSGTTGSSHLNPEAIVGPKLDSPESKHSSHSSDDRPFVIVRKFTLAHEGRPFERLREITQLQYSSWPDFGAPADPAHVLGLVQQCNAVVKATASSNQSPLERPVLVHCSAGCGRTGTFCTVDTVLDLLKRQKSAREVARKRQAVSPLDTQPQSSSSSSHPSSQGGDNPFFSPAPPEPGQGTKKDTEDWIYKDEMDLIEETVEEFRLQRISMVQSLRQFVLCYETVLEWLCTREGGGSD